MAKRLHPERVTGWGSQDAVFKNLIHRVKPRTIIEVGTFLGASALHMARLTRKLRLQTQILCVDHFHGWAGFTDQVNDIPTINGDVMLYCLFMQNIVSFNTMEMIFLVPCSSSSMLVKMYEMGVYGDLVEINASHNFYSAWSNINWAYQIVRPSGVLFRHNYPLEEDNDGVRKTVDLFEALHGKRVHIDSDHWVIKVS